MHEGLNFTGHDINPLAVLVSRAKMGPFVHSSLLESTNLVLQLTRADNLAQTEAGFVSIDKWFQPEVQFDLSRIRRAIRSESHLWARRFLWVALAETVRLASNSRTSTYKLHARPQAEIKARTISAIDTFEAVVRKNLDALGCFRSAIGKAGHLEGDGYVGNLDIQLADSSVVTSSDENRKRHDLLITSPPYGDSTSTVAYGQFSYLPLQWIDLDDIDGSATNRALLRTTQEIDRRSLGGSTPRNLESILARMSERSDAFRKTVNLLEDQPRDRTARIAVFFGDMDRALDNILQRLREGAYMIWIVGNRHVGNLEIPMDQILTELLALREATLITSVPRRILFRRMAARNQITTMIRQEYIMVFRRQG
jgi:site-specific DNA-methyltransferase (cytosine-N4-specific)